MGKMAVVVMKHLKISTVAPPFVPASVSCPVHLEIGAVMRIGKARRTCKGGCNSQFMRQVRSLNRCLTLDGMPDATARAMTKGRAGARGLRLAASQSAGRKPCSQTS